MSRIALASLVVASLATVVAPGAAHAQEVVNTRTGASYTTLTDAISNAIADDTLEISGVLVESTVVDKSLTLVGQPGATIQSGAANILTLNASIDVTIDGLTLDGTGNTRGILATAGDNQLIVTNSVFDTGSTAGGTNGGAISIADPRLVLVLGSEFQATGLVNNATAGGAIYATATAVAPVVIEDTRFVRTRTSGAGGAVYGNNVDLVCTRCEFDHTWGGQGGAIHATFGGLTVEQSLFCASQGSLGGAIFSSSSTTEVRANLFVENTAIGGGALWVNDGDWVVDNNHFLGHGGATTIRVQNTAAVTTLRNNLLLDNAGIALSYGAGTGQAEYNWFQGNATDADIVLSATNYVGVGDPMLLDWSRDGDCSNDALWPTPVTSPLFDIGDPTVDDPDGSRSDIGAFGGESADPFYFNDNDGDGVVFLDDCDDTDLTTYPGAPEICDGVDNDCDGAVDEDTTNTDAFHEDCDGDGQGNPTPAFVQCFPPVVPPTCGGVWLSANNDGFFASSDCDDADPAVHWGADETCAAGDQNCDGDDDQGAVDAYTYYQDGDLDGWGNAILEQSCVGPIPPPGNSTQTGDCADADPNVYPGAPDACGDGTDSDCDGGDGTAADQQDWYPDADGDGYGDQGATPVVDCRDLTALGYVTDGTDCDDAESVVHPGAPEVCDGLDNDCNGTVDGTNTPLDWYLDADGDGYGDDAAAVSADCAPTGYVAAGGDCDDAEPLVNPGALEVCDGIDNDCSGAADDIGTTVTWYQDVDGDGFGDDATATGSGCAPGSDWVTVGGDCDDTDATVYPGAPELCDGQVNACGGALPADEADADADGYVVCTIDPGGWDGDPGVVGGDDCDDGDDTVYPGAPETCDLVDEDCNGVVDDLNAPVDWMRDVDSDGFGDPATAVFADCPPTDGYTTLGDDCDDMDDTVFPGAPELCDGQVNDCGQPLPATEADLDGDHHVACTWDIGGWDGDPGVVGGDDCDDADPAINPGAAEICDGIDNDCDGNVDDTNTPIDWYQDLDGDGFGDDTTAASSECAPGPTWTSNGGDCDDADPAVNPGATEVCNGVDDDCDGTVDDTGSPSTWYQDADADGFGDDATATPSDCPPGPQWIPTGGDCNDADPLVSPAGTEVCNGVDDDCDGTVDDTGATSTWYADADGDGYGDDATATVASCPPGPQYVTIGGDCDDGHPGVNPGAVEVDDDIDNDCDGEIDEGFDDFCDQSWPWWSWEFWWCAIWRIFGWC